MKNDFLVSYILPLTFFLIMLGIGVNLSIKKLALTMSKKKFILLGLIFQLALLPLVASAIILLAELDDVFGYGLLILSLCPGGASSNLFTFLAKGDLELSSLLTLITGFITPFTLPIVVQLLGNLLFQDSYIVQLNILTTIINLLLLTIVPLGLGLALNYYNNELGLKISGPLKKISTIFLILVVLGIIIKNIPNFNVTFVKGWVPALLLNIIAVSLVLIICKVFKIEQSKRITFSIETGIQNGMMALFITGTLLKNETMSLVPAGYSITMYLSAFSIVYAMRRQVKKQNSML